jgi:DHA1 family inner membrane transport protein
MGGFGIGLTEFSIVGLLPQIAHDYKVSVATAGLLVSGYAASVALGGVVITIAVTRFDRKRVLITLMSLFIVGNLISAVAPTFEIMLLGRVVAALCHGTFFGIGAVLAADIVDPSKKASAVSIMFGGLTLANVLGVPLGTLLGQAFGWRSTFVAISAIGVIALAGIWSLVPHHRAQPGGHLPRSLHAEFGAFRHIQVWLSLALTVLGFGGMFGAFTYIAYTLTSVSGFTVAAIPWLLIAFGGGVFAGNIVGGRAADRNLTLTLVTLLTALTCVLVIFALTAGNQLLTVINLVLMGGLGFACVPGLQMRVLHYAGAAPTLASGANIAAFNLGNALGAWIGGLTISAGLGYTSPLWDAAAMTALGLVVLLAATANSRHRQAA